MHRDKFPRTLDEAFGPGTSREFDSDYPFIWWRIFLVVCVLALAVVWYVL